MAHKYLRDCIVLANDALNEHYFRLRVQCGEEIGLAQPGQFVQVRVDGSSDTYLRRPISIHDVNASTHTLDLLINQVGAGTRTLSRLQVGDTVNLLYPLGRGFSLPAASSRLLLVGGGVGIAPLLYLGRVLHASGHQVAFLLGFRSSHEMFPLDAYQAVGELFLTTEDGSVGKQGFVTQHTVWQERLFDRVCTCGPLPMMRAVASTCARLHTDCEVSLENKMACGIGACLCCVTETQEGNQCVCTEGPVFNVKELTWQI